MFQQLNWTDFVAAAFKLINKTPQVKNMRVVVYAPDFLRNMSKYLMKNVFTHPDGVRYALTLIYFIIKQEIEKIEGYYFIYC